MRIYEATTEQFSDDVQHNRIADKVSAAFSAHYGRAPSSSEVNSWANSLMFVENVLQMKTLRDNYILVEYELPYTSNRIDCLLFGKSAAGLNNVVVIELKQWSRVEPSEVDGNVVTFVGGANRVVAHPSLQAKAYSVYLRDFVSLFSEDHTELYSCVYCHNYKLRDADPLLDPRFAKAMEASPVFSRSDAEMLGDYLKEKLGAGGGIELFGRFRDSRIRPSKKLLEHTAAVVKGEAVFNLIDDQLAAFNAIMACANKASRAKTKSVVLVRGGPGTGKSVIALNVLAELASRGVTVMHATGSKTFTSILHKILGNRARNQFQYFNSFIPSRVDEDGVDVLICDEAHRIRESSNHRFTRSEHRSSMAQIEELMRAARVCVFFLDDFQVVRAGEIGSSTLIGDTAKRLGMSLHEYTLQAQFRCAGSDGYLSWINNTLEVGEAGVKTLTRQHKVDFRIFSTPAELYAAIRTRHEAKPNSGRLVAGFCWPWSSPRPDGTLVNDVTIGDFSMPWEGKDSQDTRIALAPGIPPWYLWGHDPNGINQIGCIYTVQGLEFDYVGVIFGNDLKYNPARKTWEARMENSYDGQLKRQGGDHLQYLKNIYRVLLTRGMKGCYVHFVDQHTEAFFRSRIAADGPNS